ncbi:MAG: hypothetical protein DRP29_00330 [Thermodesulfobacteriota bacterium]|nr:MAG: hypothetical protein DRP29_00330 [Thermodesulfobacteriota bacterium]
MIVEKIQEYIEKKRKISPVHVNRASEIGHPCYRYLYFLRTAWDQAQLPTYKQQLVFDEGKLQERAVLRLLEDAGFDIVEQQRPYEIRELKLVGHIDAKIRVNNKLFPLEIKSMSPYFFESLHVVKDFLNHRYAHIRKIPFQLQAYLMLANYKEAVLLLKNRSSGELKEIVVVQDEKMQNEIRVKCQTINDLVEKQVAPEIHEEFDEKICSTCKFAHICLPDVKRKNEMRIVDDEELIALLEKREQLKPFHDEYLEVDKILSKRLEGIEKAIIGDFIVTGKWVHRKAYKVPETTYWKKRILRVVKK